ncbi:MAG TPA: T9SS type A sorting domain-containing protein [bacterium]|nr:T9SS type A sorting domain-containing protein [bacterium]
MRKITKNIFIVAFLLILILSVQTRAAAKICTQNSVQDSVVYLDLPERSPDAVEGTEFANQITGLSIRKREQAIVNQIMAGNVPLFSRKLTSIKLNRTLGSENYAVTFFSVNDYMAIGSEQDYIYIPMMPSTAQHLADELESSLPTKKLVDIIYSKAKVKLDPQPISWSEENVTVPVFMDHTNLINQQLDDKGLARPIDSLIAGHKKDIIISNRIYSSDRDYDRVVIYGWHRSENDPIQPVYNGHSNLYADYSHGVRLISNIIFINGQKDTLQNLLTDANLAELMSNEGRISKPYYPDSDWFTSVENSSQSLPESFHLYQNYPNPFNSSTTIKYFLPNPSRVKIDIFNSSGNLIQTIFDDKRGEGHHKIKWETNNMASGIYFYKVQAEKALHIKKCVLIK